MPLSPSYAWIYQFYVFLSQILSVSAAQNYTSYLFAYFTGEGQENGEAISFAVSGQYDALKWTEVRQGKPILLSNVGTRGVRDPTIIKARDGSKFWIIATDLKMYKSGMSWDAAGRQGSRSLVIWESLDLVRWKGPRLVQVSPPEAGNTWAPEAIWDPQLKQYHIYWASSLYDKADTQHTGKSYYRILKSMTTDFIKFTSAEKYIDTGYSVIDTTIIWDEKTKKFHRFSKDERPNGQGAGKSENGKFIFQEESSSINGPWKMIRKGVGRGAISRGEGPLVFPDNKQQNKWYMFIDEFGGRGYVPFETTSIEKATWKVPVKYSLPKRPRHGSVIAITEEERNRILAIK